MKLFLRVLLALLSLLLAAAVAVSAAASLGVYTVRQTLSPEFVADTVDGLNYAAVRFPDGFGGFTTILDELNGTVGYYGLGFTEESLNEMIRALSFDDIFRGYMQDFRSWLLDYGPKPYLDPEEAARTVVGGLDQQVLGFLSFFMDPALLVEDTIARFTESGELEERLDALEPARRVLSQDTLIFLLSAVGVLLVLLFLTRRMKLLPTLTVAGLAFCAAGAALTFAPQLLAAQKNAVLVDLSMPESTLDILYLPLMEAIVRNGRVLLIAGAAVAVAAGVIWGIAAQAARARRAGALS